MGVSKVQVVEELEALCDFYEKKYGKGGAFNPYKYYKKKQNSNEPVYFVGVPGFSVAVVMTLMIVSTVFFISKPYPWWSWIFYLVFWAYAVRFGLKVDKAKQVRYMALSLSKHAINSIKKSHQVEDESEAQKLLKQAKEFLEKAYSWVDEPPIKKQLELIKID